MTRRPVVVIGAGPAGLAAVLELRRGGVEVVVVDEQARPGGQIYRQPPASFVAAPPPRRSPYAFGKRLIAEASAAAGVEWLHETTAWGGFENTRHGIDLALDGPAGVSHITGSHLLIASGAYDLPVAFPGWTLPGVMSAGGVQAFVKSQHFVPGRRLVLAGAHPLLLIVADQLLQVGADIAAVAVAHARPSFGGAASDLGALRGNWSRVLDLARPLRRLRAARVPLSFSTLPVAAEGTESLERVRLARVGKDWRPTGDERELDCDTLAIGFGFVASSELARQLGCATRCDPDAGGWIIDHDDWMRSSLGTVAVAGEVTGVAGADQAVDEGRLAALGILLDLGHIDAGEAHRRAAPIRHRLTRHRRFSSLVQRRFSFPGAAIDALATDPTVLCRCEGITAGALRQSLAEHAHLGTLDAVKLLTRVGMGPCQGRMCQSSAAHVVAAATGRPVESLGPFRSRPPVKPIPLARLAETTSIDRPPPAASGL